MAGRYAPIGEYGVIGDLYTVALVGMDGSIDFLCLPNFDSPSVFAALVDAERGGRFQIAPVLEGAVRKQLYLPDTNVLLTRFLDVDGVAELSDFMPAADAGQAHNVVRRAKTVRGEVRFQMRCDPRFDYARVTHTAERRSDTDLRPPRDDRGRAQLGLSLHLDPRLVVHALRAHAPRLHAGSGGLHGLGDGALPRARARRLAADHVWAGRPSRAARGDPAPPRGLHGLRSRADRQRGLRQPPARYLRRAAGLRLSVRQVRLSHRVRRLDHHRAADGLGLRQLAPAGRGHLGGARRTAGVPLLAGDVLGGCRPCHPARHQALVPRSPGALARGSGHDLRRRLHSLLGSDAARVHAARRRHHARRRGAADAARPLRLPHRPALDLDAARDRARPGERLAGLSLSPRRRILRRSHRERRYLLDVLLLVRRVPLPHGGSAAGAVLLREDARLRQSPRTVRRGAGSAGTAPRQLPPGVHAPGAHQRRLRSRPPALGRRPCRVIATRRRWAIRPRQFTTSCRGAWVTASQPFAVMIDVSPRHMLRPVRLLSRIMWTKNTMPGASTWGLPV